MVKCIICNENLKRTYVRITEKKGKKLVRKWKGIGYFCLNDNIFISDKELPKYIKNQKSNK